MHAVESYRLKLVIFIYIYLFNKSIVLSEELIKFSETDSCLLDEFYNVNLLQCSKCNHHINLVPTNDGLSCECNAGSIIIPSIGGEFPRCQLCPAEQSPSFDQRECVPCPNVTYSGEGNDTVAECGACPLNKVPVGLDWSGNVLENTTCVSCATGYTPRSPNNKQSLGLCEPCTMRAPAALSVNCSCPSLVNELLEPPGEPPICAPRSSLASWPTGDKANTVDFDNGETVVSQFLRDRLRSSVLLCQLGNRTACQCLANLCALVLYKDNMGDDGVRPTACRAFRDVHRIPPSGSIIPGVDSRPWLMYGEGDAPSVLARRKLAPVRFSLNAEANTSLLHLRAAQFDVSGAFLGLARGGANLLSVCPPHEQRDTLGLRFGARYRLNCAVHARHLAQQPALLQDLYLQIRSPETGEKLYALPVLVRNMHTNKGPDPSSWQLVRRVFLVDHVLGRNGGNVPQVMRYLQSCVIRVKVLGKEGPGQILPPLIEVTYAELTQAQITNNDAVTVSLSVDWEMEHTSIYGVQVAAGVLGALGAVWAGVAAWSQSRRAGQGGSSLDLATLARLVVLACGPVANALLLVAGCSALLTLLLYKGQAQPHTLLPSALHEALIRDLVISAAALKVVEVLRLLWTQLQVDLFFMDWERPHSTLPQTPGCVQSIPAPVSIWRCYLVANEWNEIQATRRTSVAMQLLITIFFLQVVGIEHWASPDPELHLSAQANEKDGNSYILRFAVALTVYISIYLIQCVLILGFYERYVENSIQQFIDLCSVANISVFVLTNENYGYYLHGRSAHGSADTDMRTLGEQLRREQEDLCAHRGLVPGSEQQTFEMALPPKMRAFSRRITAPLTAAAHQPNRRLVSGNKNGIMWQGNEERIAQAYNSMNKFLAAFFQHAIRDLDYEVKEKAFLEKLLDIELSDVADKAVLFTDDGHSFDRVLFHGHEFTLFTFDLAVFCCAEIITGDFLSATIITALIAKCLVVIRQIGGRRNVARKTLVDERFLI